jgi:hypothetical protein
MLALYRPRCLLHSSRFLHVRTLRTLPRRIPSYLKTWDPTLHTPRRRHQPSIEPKLAPGITWKDDATRIDQDKLHQPLVDIEDNGAPSERGVPSYKKLKHLLSLATSQKIDRVGMRRPLWKAYANVKHLDKRLLLNLTCQDWDLLWQTQALESFDNQNRTLHLKELFVDMLSARAVPTPSQRAEYLECLFLIGKEEQALQEWESDHSGIDISAYQDCEREHFEVGIKMHALVGNTDRARKLMNQLYERSPEEKPSLILMVLRAHTSSADPRHHDAAYVMYGKMKRLFARQMTLKDYDGCMVGFLEAGKLSYAQEVFRDLVNNGVLGTSGTTRDVEEVLKRLHMLYRLGTDISAMTTIALDAVVVLPNTYYSHLFGDWMKSAVVQKAPEAAAQILDMMFRQGYAPETYHLNMLLKALIRTKESPSVLKAENIGWRMIDEARKAHKRKHKLPSEHERISSDEISIPVTLEAVRQLPMADVTTFALIMHHHAQRLQWEHVDYLSRQLKETSVIPNALIMNVLIDNKTRQGAYVEAWSIYKQLTNPSDDGSSEGVFPNGASLRHLWKMLRLALGDHATRHDPNLPSPRELLKEMVDWWTLCHRRYDAERFRMGLAAANHGAISGLILHCFSYTQDLAGALVALHVLRHKFNIFPSDKDADILQRQMAWIDMSRESESSRSQYFHSRSNKRNSEKVIKVYQILLQRRLEKLDLSQKEVEALTEEEIGDMGLNLLSEFIRVVMKRGYPEGVVEAMIDAARHSVGCPGLPTGDMDALEVA